ncbi:MAG: hypothetical protein AB7P52_12335 [Alphaproteobacteria bacterium]
MGSFVKRARLPALVLAVALSAGLAGQSRADALSEYLFWYSMGEATELAAESYADYEAERQLWRDNIAAAKEELERCGGCASAQAELDKWQGIENQFQDVAGALAQSVGMPPILAEVLGIDLPMTTGPTAEQLKQREVVRPDWVAERPAFCQVAVDDHLNCLRNHQAQSGSMIILDSVELSPEGACYDSYKLYQHCAVENYDAFAGEQALRKARASGKIIPEYIKDVQSPAIFYGEVPDDFVPDLPPDNIVSDELNEGDVAEIRFLMEKKAPDALDRIVLAEFYFLAVDPKSVCNGEPSDEIQRRVCEDLWYFYRLEPMPLVLTCYYAGETHSKYYALHLYWYKARPAVAEPADLLSHSHTHPILRIGEARAHCPATLAEARETDSQYQAKLASLSAEVPEVSAAAVTPRPAWQQKLHEEEAAEREEANDRLRRKTELEAARGAAMAEFPFEGLYRLERTVDGKTTTSECTMVLGTEVTSEFVLRCRDSDGTMQWGEAQLRSGTLYGPNEQGEVVLVATIIQYLDVSLAPASLWLRLAVDLDHKKSGQGDALVTVAPDGDAAEAGAVSGRLVRTGDLVRQIADRPLEGGYEMELSVDGVSLAADCTIKREPWSESFRFPTVCTTGDGATFKGEGYPVSRDGAAVKFVSWWPRRFIVNGKDVGDMYFIVDPAARDKAADDGALIAHADNGISGRLVRTGGMQTAALEEARTDGVAGEARQVPKGDETLSSGGQCSTASIAGTYPSQYGPIVCEPGETGLDCCYGSPCVNRLHLGLAPDGTRLTGEWEEGSQRGYAEFGVTASCEMGEGRWSRSLDPNRIDGSWTVSRKH